jgi:hypothetical protein
MFCQEGIGQMSRQDRNVSLPGENRNGCGKITENEVEGGRKKGGRQYSVNPGVYRFSIRALEKIRTGAVPECQTLESYHITNIKNRKFPAPRNPQPKPFRKEVHQKRGL